MEIRRAGLKDQADWDGYIERCHPGSSPYHLFGWGRAVSEAYGHAMYYLIAEENGRIVGVLPLVYLKPPFIQGEMVSLPFCDIGGCLADSEGITKALVSEAVSLGRKFGAGKIEIREGRAPLPEMEGVLGPVDVQSPKVRMVLGLPASSEELMSGFKSKLRSQIRKSTMNGLGFRWGSIEEMGTFYSVFSENMRSLGSPVHSKDWFLSVMEHLQERARMGIVSVKETPVGVGLILCHGKLVTIPWASTLRDYNSLSPNMLLYWNFLKYAADKGFSFFDFGRSTPGEGTFKFKEQWGAKPHKLYWQTISNKNRHRFGPSGSKGRSMAENLWKRVPLPIANALGPVIRRYISL